MSTSGIGPISNFDAWKSDSREVPVPDSAIDAEHALKDALERAVIGCNSYASRNYQFRLIACELDGDERLEVRLEIGAPVEHAREELASKLKNLGQRLLDSGG